MATRVIIYQALAKAHSAEVAKRLVRQVLYETEFGAKALARGGPYSTGNLADSIHSDGPHLTGTSVTGTVGSTLSYARSVHDGAKVHWIFPKASKGVVRFGSRRRPQLRFFWRRAGKVVFLPHIPGSPGKIGRSHPGVQGKHYLTEPLRNAARRHGFRFVRTDL
jgi:hypothetical protein